MVIPIDIQRLDAAQRSRRSPVAETQGRLLNRLYQRKLVVDRLIRSLEVYRAATTRAIPN
jgi:hypothetical protein